MSKLDDVMALLPDVIDKEDSRFAQLVSVWLEQMNEIRATVERISAWKSIEQAEGAALDDIGGNLGQPRGQATDEIYRILLRSKLARMNASGDIDSIIGVLALALNTDPSVLAIREKQNDAHDPEPAAIQVVKVPYEQLNRVGMSPAQFVRLVQSVTSAGVRVAQVDLSGTFELSSMADEPEQSEHGLADEAMIVGGTLGDVYTPGHDYPIPV
ncbi:hypothetical protein L5D93_16400 [Paenibacillus thiaminolyticus]|nr:hypothetical protein [Paenibacillus thiaminolyticus]